MTDNEIWDEVYNRIRDGYGSFICIELARLLNTDHLQFRVRHLLDGSYTLGQWMYRHHPELVPHVESHSEYQFQQDKFREALWVRCHLNIIV